ncbi:MAG: BlaI/MecI/CopY family transcriptional regulator [Lachnospiraceae bacterium]|nr:BlaI/MecI/CopY family transcriptional regulator [Lachnospiraceae bacterium]
MKQTVLSDGEWKLMNLLWDHSPRTIGELVEALKDDTGWSKTTIFVMLKRMIEKEIVRMDGSKRCQEYYPVLERESAARCETQNFLSKVYQGSIGMMVSSMTSRKELSREEIEELYQIIRDAREKE